MKDKKEEIRFSPRALTEIHMGKTSINNSVKSNISTKRAQKKVNGKYEVKVVGGVKFMKLKDY